MLPGLRPLACTWERLRDRNRWPRCWWWPVRSERAADKGTDWSTQHKEVSQTILRTMLTVVAYSAFCLFTLATPDSEILENKIKIPFANMELNFIDFVFIGPAILVGLLVYLHIFVGYWHEIPSQTLGRPVPYLFNLEGKVPRFASSFLFYFLLPIVLYSFIYKAHPHTNTRFLELVAAIVTVGLVLLRIRRWEDSQQDRRRTSYRLLWLALGCFVLVSVFDALSLIQQVVVRADRLETEPRSLRVRGLDLAKQDLRKLDLARYDLTMANLQGANLQGLDLSNMDLSKANLRDANLEGARLVGSDLSHVHLGNSNLRNAILDSALIRLVHLGDADLRGASLRDAFFENPLLRHTDLRGVRNLTCEQLRSGTGWEMSYRDLELSCGKKIPSKP